MKPATKRSILRWIHLVIAIPILGYIYSPFAELPSYAAVTRFILAAHYRSEFLATPTLIRFDYAEGQDGAEPTLLVKASTLLLKYIVQGVRMQLAFSRLGDRLLYGLRVIDDEKKAAILWSILER